MKPLGASGAWEELWPQVSSLRQNPDGTMELTLKTGAVVIWGPMDSDRLLWKEGRWWMQDSISQNSGQDEEKVVAS